MAGVRKFQDIMTYSRSTTGTYIGSDGLLKTAAVDEARIEYDGSGNVQGLLLEPISTNQFPQSTTFGGFTTVTGGSLTAGQSPDPAGGSSAYLWIDGNTSPDQAQLQYVKSGITASSTNRWTSSIFVKKPSRSDAVSTFELQNFFTGGTTQNVYSRWAFDTNGVLSLTTQGGDEGTTEPFNVGYDTLANGWYRIYQTFQDVSGTTNTNVLFRVYSGQRSESGGSGDQDGSLLVYGPQLEQNHMVTSYIPTTGVEVTRQPDKAYIDIDQFEVKQDRGTFVAEVNNLKWATAVPGAYPRVIEFGNTTNITDRLIVMLVNGPENIIYSSVVTDGSNQGDITYQDFANSVDVGPFNGKVALRYDETSQGAAKDGVLIASEPPTGNIVGQRPYRTRLALRAEANAATGNGDGVAFHLKSLKYYPRKVSDTELSNFSTQVVQEGLVLNLDAGISPSYSGSGSTWYDLTGTQNFDEYDTGSFVSYNSGFGGYFDINKSTTAGSEGGGGFTANASGVLEAATFLYNPHTISIWVRVNDRQPFFYYDTNATTETYSQIIAWRGYHSGLSFNNTHIRYVLWNGTSGTSNIYLNWSSTSLSEGDWFNLVVRRSTGGATELIINNQVLAGPTALTASATGISTTNNIRIGHATTIPGTFSYSSEQDISSVALYNRALTNAEITQNFNSVKDRYGL